MIAKKEFIGKEAKIVYAGKTFEGTIIDETKNTLVLEAQGKNITIIKSNAVLWMGGMKIEGEKITKRPEDRIKAC